MNNITIIPVKNLPEFSPKFDLADELNSKKANWQIHAYGNVGHAFTNPEANDRNSGLFYDAHADQHSWREMSNFFEKIFS